MTATEQRARGVHALRARAGEWVRQERARGYGGSTCALCGESHQAGFAFYEGAAQSTAFVCDECADLMVEEVA
jgi:hypothetical protein